MPGSFVPAPAELWRFLPEIILTLAGAFLMVLAPLVRDRRQNALGYVAAYLFFAALVAALAAHLDPGPAFRGLLVVDGYATFFRVLVIVVGLFTVMISFPYLGREHADRGEYYALLMFSVVGQCLMVTAGDLIMLFIGLEISSISSYVLAGFLRRRAQAVEAALKYFLLGSFATAFLLFGVAWIYGMTGSTSLMEIRNAVLMLNQPGPVFLSAAAVALIFAGFAFKVSAWPFQVWAPDVYEGAPAPVAGFLSAGPKAAAFAALVRVLVVGFAPFSPRWEPLLWLVALATMAVGNFAALVQSNIKRLLAYSSIAHAGYVLVAVTAHSEIGTAAVMFYLAAYALMNIGAFALVAHLSGKDERYVSINDYAGLGARQPVAAALLTIFLLSLIGVPLTAGFFGKFYIFRAAIRADLIWLTVLGLLLSAVAACYYLRIIVVMYMREPENGAAEAPPLGGALGAVVWVSALGTLLLGIWPSLVLRAATEWALLVR